MIHEGATMTIAIAADHAGVNYKRRVLELLEKLGHTVLNFGTDSEESCDYPDPAYAAAKAVSEGKAERGVLVCGSGIGVAIVANKVQGIRAADCVTVEMAQLCREHNDCNVLTIGERLVDWETAEQIITTFLNSPGAVNERHERRVRKIHELTGL